MTIEQKLEAVLDANPWLDARRLSSRTGAVLKENSSAKVKRSKIIKIANEVQEALAPFVTCRPGCSHCCHTTRAMYEHEAVLLAQVTGRKMTTLSWRPPQEVVDDEARFAGKPCPFLVENLCSVYEHRPFSCRIMHSLNDDAADCAKVGAEPVRINMVGPQLLDRPYMAVSFAKDADEPWGNIQEFFPD